jgi:hypothetical protein
MFEEVIHKPFEILSNLARPRLGCIIECRKISWTRRAIRNGLAQLPHLVDFAQ